MTPTEYVSSGSRLDGVAAVGQIVGYSGSVVQWEPMRVTEVTPDGQFSLYTLRNLESGAAATSDCRQRGWTYGRPVRDDDAPCEDKLARALRKVEMLERYAALLVPAKEGAQRAIELEAQEMENDILRCLCGEAAQCTGDVGSDEARELTVRLNQAWRGEDPVGRAADRNDGGEEAIP